jgi:hypothetical protein
VAPHVWALHVLGARLGRALAGITDFRRRIVLVAFVVGAAFAALEYAVHVALQRSGVGEAWKPVVDASTVCAGATGFALLWLFSYRQRRRQVRAELDKIAELNHRVRNALEVIIAVQYHAPEDQERIILDAVSRIDATLRDLFPAPHPRHHLLR